MVGFFTLVPDIVGPDLRNHWHAVRLPAKSTAPENHGGRPGYRHYWPPAAIPRCAVEIGIGAGHFALLHQDLVIGGAGDLIFNRLARARWLTARLWTRCATSCSFSPMCLALRLAPFLVVTRVEGIAGHGIGKGAGTGVAAATQEGEEPVFNSSDRPLRAPAIRPGRTPCFAQR